MLHFISISSILLFAMPGIFFGIFFFPLIKLARVMSTVNFQKLQKSRENLLANSNDMLTNWLVNPGSGM